MPDDHPDPGSRSGVTTSDPGDREFMRRRHGSMLAIATGIVLAAVLLEVPSPDRVELWCLPGVKLPGMCLSRAWFDIECPGCGLTRSFIHLAHADVAGSLGAHRIGWLMAVAVLLQFPYRTLALVRKADHPLGTTVPKLFGMALIFLLIGNWLLGLFL